MKQNCLWQAVNQDWYPHAQSKDTAEKLHKALSWAAVHLASRCLLSAAELRPNIVLDMGEV